ncbi:MAG: ammonium transporter [Candidatus Altiarchaeota archaeon]
MKQIIIVYTTLLLLLLTQSASAIDTSKLNAGDTAWVLVAAALVLLMTPGVGFFYGGMVRKKNVLAIITQSFIIIALVSIQWILVGYSLAFGPDIGGVIGGLDHVGLNGIGMGANPTYSETIPEYAFLIFQAMFAIITPALIIGSFADRMKFSSFLVFTLLWTTFIYDPLCHWVWGDGGWIRAMGALDFAGGTVVHISAGVSALAAALVLGRRVELSNGGEIKPHDITMVILGASILWFGWFGFNAGSALAANGLAAHAFVVTNTAAAAAAISWMLVSWSRDKKPSSMGIVTGAVCGLVAITPAAGFVSPLAAIVIGAIAGAVCFIMILFIKNKTRIDDALDVMACHGMGGIIGALLTGVFASTMINPGGADGFMAGNPHLLLVQAASVLVTMIYAFTSTIVIMKVIDLIMGLRVRREEEIIGLDLTQHGEEAYPDMDLPA